MITHPMTANLKMMMIYLGKREIDIATKARRGVYVVNY